VLSERQDQEMIVPVQEIGAVHDQALEDPGILPQQGRHVLELPAARTGPSTGRALFPY
jgi:hypothetical protein